MATRHDIIHIDFQANAGKANVALQALQSEAQKARDKVNGLRAQLQNAINAKMPTADIQKLENELKLAQKEAKQWQSALNNNMKGVRALDEAIKMFNKGKGSVEEMNAALSKTALNAAKLQQSRSDKGSKAWKEMDALIVALEQNIMKCNTATNSLVSTIKNGGTASKDTLIKARSDLQQMIALEEQGTNAWKKYSAQLKTVEGALERITAEEQRMAGQNALAKVFSGEYITKSNVEIEKLIASIKQYQSTIVDPNGNGRRHFMATETALKKLSEQLGKTKGDIVSVQQALKVASAAGTANRFGAGLHAQGNKAAQAFRKTTEALNQLQQKRQTYTIIQQNGLSITAQEQAMLAKLDAQIAATAARQERLRNEMIQVGNAANLSTKQITQSIAVLRQQQEVVAAGSPAWKQYEAAINTLEERMKIMRGEAISLYDAMRLSQKAGGQGFTGTAKQLQLSEQAIQKAAASVRKGSAEWMKYQEALARLRVEMQNTGMTSERMRTVIAKPANAKNLNELSAAVKRAKAELDLMAGTVGKNSKEYANLAAQTKKAEIQMKSLQAQSHGTASSFDKAWSRLKTYIGLYMGAAIAIQKLVSTMGDIMELSDKMGEVRKTTGFTAEEVGRLSDSLTRLDTRTPIVNLMELSAAAGQLGLKTQEDVRGFTEAANMLMVALPEMGKEGATAMLKVALATGEIGKIQRQMQEGLIEGSSATAVAMTKIGSTIDQLRASSAAAAPAITDFVKRVGAVGAQSGITIDQVAALGSTVDALGMRVEMSATALSRMIPAIKNNAFDVARAIGMVPEDLRKMFDRAGGGMDAMLAIFQHIKDAGLNEEGIEKMLGMGGMADIMKDLNQQGARAGIVFAGLSQNVEELQRQLAVAKTAYEENMAIQREYEKMNQTTAARWERLKNQIEEMFLGDNSQMVLGGIIDGIRKIVDLLGGNGGVSYTLRIILTYMALIKVGLWQGIVKGFTAALAGIKNVGVALGIVKGQMTAMQWGNIFTALAGAALYAVMAFKHLYNALRSASKAIADANLQTKLAIDRFEGYYDTLNTTSKALAQAQREHSSLSAEVDRLRKSTDSSAEATANLEKKEKMLKDAENAVTKASNDHRTAIANMNSIYGKYLGFLLTEYDRAELVAAAHDKITAAIRREMLVKQQQAALGKVDDQYTADLSNNLAALSEELTKNGRLSTKQAAQSKRDLQKFIRDNISYNADTGKNTYSTAVEKMLRGKGLDIDKASANEVIALWFDQYLDKNFHLDEGSRQRITGVKISSDYKTGWGNVYTPFGNNLRGGYASTYIDYITDQKQTLDVFTGELADAVEQDEKATEKIVEELRIKATKAQEKIASTKNDKEMNKAYEDLASALEGLDRNIGSLDPTKNRRLISDIRNQADSLSKSVDANKLSAARVRVNSIFQRALGNAVHGNVSGSTESQKNPWGSSQPAESVNYADMSAEVLVNRRKQMNDFVNAIQTDSDVQSVLAEDKALKKAIENGMASDMRTVIEWYNTERLKIQDELHARHLTNTGDWMDPKKQKARKKRLQEEWRYYLDELDAYYTERNSRIQEAGNEEGITQAEVQNRTLANEAEWHQRRAELQKLYADKGVEVTRQEQDAIFDIISERTGDDAKFVEKTIGKTVGFMKKIGEKSPTEYRKALGMLDKGMEKDFLLQQQAIAKQMQAIQDIIDKERPFNGITKNLRENLATMGILTAEMTAERDRLMTAGEDMSDFNARQAAEELRRTVFMLGEAEHVYSSTVEDVMRRMADAGMEAWADELKRNPKMQEGLMAQLRQTYDAIQDAIKKEASLIKKQVEIQWNDALMPDGRSMKQSFEATLSALGLTEDRVKRANSLIGAGQASERVADRLAIKQMEIRLRMQEAYFNMLRKIGSERIAQLEAAGRYEDAEHVRKSLNLALSEEQKKLDEQRVAIANQLEESQNRLYTAMREWASLMSSSVQSLFEASNAGNREYYNERAKMSLTGRGGPGAGTYIVIDNEGTSGARAHYEYLDERQALERHREIEQQNAVADAWKKVMDDVNQKMSDMITDQINAMLQNASIDANTKGLDLNTEALRQMTEQLAEGVELKQTPTTTTTTPAAATKQDTVEAVKEAIKDISGRPRRKGTKVDPHDNSTWGYAAKKREGLSVVDTDEPDSMPNQSMPEMSREALGDNTDALRQLTSAILGGKQTEKPKKEKFEAPEYDENDPSTWGRAERKRAGYQVDGGDMPDAMPVDPMTAAQAKIDADNLVTDTKLANLDKVKKGEQQTDKSIVSSSQAAFAKMTLAANLYGVAYQAMSNDNLSTTQKFEMMALQAVGQYAIGALTTEMAAASAKAATDSPGVLGTLWKQLGSAAVPVFAIFTGLLGGLMGLATSKIAKAKSTISQATGSSVGAGRLSTGMLTYAEGNVNEFTDPSSLTPGRQYNVDAADGRTYRARYMGRNPRTHLTNGPEFHLSGEKGREMIIDAGTTRQITMNDNEIWHAIQTLSGGGRMRRSLRRGRGVRAFADGNTEDFEGIVGGDGMSADTGMPGFDPVAIQASLDRNSAVQEALLERLNQPIETFVSPYGPRGIVAGYDRAKKEALRHGEKHT